MLDVRIMADDLTGALDAAARVVHACGPLPVRWNLAPRTGAMAFDTGSRELGRAEAVAAVRSAMPLMAGAAIAYKKIDSQWRGNTAAEIAAAFSAGEYRHGVIAAAFPAQGRFTRKGRQWVRGSDGTETMAATDLVAGLAAEGLAVTLCAPGDTVPPGLSLWDADSDGDLVRIAAAGRELPAPPLWCGSAGLAGALVGVDAAPVPLFRQPLLGVFGSDSAAIKRQLDVLGERVRRLPPGQDYPVAIYDLSPAGTMSRADAARVIAASINRLCDRVARPASIVAAGGETLRALCIATGTDHLVVDGEFETGVPMSIIQGGRWNGVRIVSKSGAFGDDDLIKRIVAAAAPVVLGESVA
jgi:D-threonate/D-erythronate kinase